MNYLHRAPVPLDQICFDVAPFVQVYSASPYSKCEQCQSRVATAVLVKIFSEYNGMCGAVPIHRIVLLPCGCAPSLSRQLSSQALTAVALALE